MSPKYHSYLLRCMETRSQSPDPSKPGSIWRFSLQDPKSGVVHNFSDLEALMAFMQGFLDANTTKEQELPSISESPRE